MRLAGEKPLEKMILSGEMQAAVSFPRVWERVSHAGCDTGLSQGRLMVLCPPNLTFLSIMYALLGKGRARSIFGLVLGARHQGHVQDGRKHTAVQHFFFLVWT